MPRRWRGWSDTAEALERVLDDAASMPSVSRVAHDPVTAPTVAAELGESSMSPRPRIRQHEVVTLRRE